MPKCVVLGITGSIAAYKAAEIVSRLKKKDVDVRVILTKAGAEFITPLTLETLSHAPVTVDMFHRETPWEVEHIALAKRADVFLVAPASADILAKAAHGIADDMLSTTLLATRAPVVFAPAMNVNMYEHPANEENMRILRERGCFFIEPEEGLLACGDSGKGRMAEPCEIVDYVMAMLNPKQDLAGKHIVVSAGPTIEDIDPVRYLTNRSSGKMGYALAEAACARGAKVTLVSGPTALACPNGVTRVDVRSSEDMYQAVNSVFDGCDALVMAAAPADFTPVSSSDHKIKKDGEGMTLSLKPTRDILRAMGAKKAHQILAGFAAETRDLEHYAKSKLEKKNLDMIFANDVSAPNAGFAVSTNALTMYARDGEKAESGLMSKLDAAHWVLDQVAKRMN